MATKKTGRYRVLRDTTVNGAPAAPGDLVDVDDETAALLIRDGMIAAVQET